MRSRLRHAALHRARYPEYGAPRRVRARRLTLAARSFVRSIAPVRVKITVSAAG